MHLVEDIIAYKLGKKAGGGGSSFPVGKIKSAGNLFYNATFDSEDIVLDFGGAALDTGLNGATSAFRIAKNGDLLHTLTIKNIVLSNVSFESAFRTNVLKKIVFENAVVAPSSLSMTFYYCSNLESIIGEIDGTHCGNYGNAFAQCVNLKVITFKPSTIKANVSLSHSGALTEASLVSIANGLDGTASGKTLTLHSTSKIDCAAIMGTNDNGTFVPDAQGSLSLSNFITTVKGWTLA